MALVRLDIISIGTLSQNRLWKETRAVRTAHGTTSLIRTAGPGGRHILIDPGLPSPALAARLFERTGIGPDRIDTIFLTSFRPAHRAGLGLFPNAQVLIHEPEQQAARHHLESLLDQSMDREIDPRVVEQELAILDRTRPAPDALADQIDLFPLPGYTPGQCGLLISFPTATVLVAGDAVPTQDHFLAAQVLPDAWDLTAAGESLQEAYEIADLIVPGHDNVFVNPRTHGL